MHQKEVGSHMIYLLHKCELINQFPFSILRYCHLYPSYDCVLSYINNDGDSNLDFIMGKMSVDDI